MKFDSSMLLSGAILTGLTVSFDGHAFFVVLGLALMGGGLILHAVPWLKKFWTRNDNQSIEND